ncbi:MAG: type II toxin-antitoxin system VapC family toxin [Myxococcales bacterium]|nr:type II toxin-antitoxin system VapC family toxin [Myxococcales bacterium]
MILLDTHAWIWWLAAPARLSRRARALIDGAEEIGVSAISPWEVTMLVVKGRLTLDRDVALWIKQALSQPRITLLALSPEVAIAAAQLGDGMHGDPADRIIVASALDRKAPLVTKDRVLRAWRGVRTVW